MREVLVKNEEFKDSPLGKIPKDWEVKKLGELANNRGEYGSGAAALEFNSDLPRYVRITDITDDGNLDPNSRASINRPNAEGYYLQKGDLLFARSGATVGKTYLYDESDGECAHAGYVIKFSLDSSVCEPCFVAQWTHSSFYWTWVKQTLRQGAQPNINAEEYKSVNLPYPPIDQQRRIAEILDTVDDTIARTSSLIIKLKQTKAGLLQDLLTRGLDGDGKLRDPQAHPEQFKDSLLGRIPRDWDIERLESFAEFITSGSRGWAAYYSDEGAMFIRIGNLTREHLNLKLNNIAYVKLPASIEGARARVQAGDLLISATADLGIIGVIPSSFEEAYVNQHIALIRLDQNRINSWWVGNYLSGELGQKKFYQLNDIGAKSGLNLQTIGALLIVVPPIQEQEKIVKIINTYNVRIRTEEAYLNKLKLHKQGLMQDLLTGKVRVKNL